MEESTFKYQKYPNQKYAIGLKSGKDTLMNRAAIQLLTFLKHVNQVVVFGDSKMNIGSKSMLDVTTNLYSNIDNKPNGKKENKKKTALARREVNYSSQGWQVDAHKNLPGLRVLYDSYPEAEWFIMIDDDTYLFMNNLETLLTKKKLDPNEPWLLGHNMYSTECDGVPVGKAGPAFVQGGAGIYMSRGAVKKVLPHLDECIVKYRDCWGK
jgi:hypothetical protein